MQVFRYVSPSGYSVNIDVENRDVTRGVFNQLQRGKPGFFLCLPQGYGRYIRITISMTAGLEPAIEFAMVDQQNLLPVWTYDPGRAGNMAYAQ